MEIISIKINSSFQLIHFFVFKKDHVCFHVNFCLNKENTKKLGFK